MNSKGICIWCFKGQQLLIEACYCPHTYCIDEHESTDVNIGSCSPERFTPNYEEYLDPLGDGDSAKHKHHAVCEVIHKKLI
jgi:hypothetical protein